MPRLRLLALPLAGLSLFGVAAAQGPQATRNQRAAITRAALAPYRDELLRNASGLCGDLTPQAAATITPGAEPGASCEQNVQRIFTATTPAVLPRTLALHLHARAISLQVHGPRATGVFSLITTSTSSGRHGTRTVRIVSLGSYLLGLRQLDGKWRVSSAAHLIESAECVPHTFGRCRPGVENLVFLLGYSEGVVIGEAIPTPSAVRRAGPREQREFTAGRTVLAETGCLACHKIGEAGNRRPGPNLTHVGARLLPRAIERALLHPQAPMPSFSRLPAHKLRDLVRFLSLLR